MPGDAEQRADVLIVGAGVIGASAALAFARAGHDVLVIERSSAPGTGATAASAAIVRVHASDAQTVAMSDDALVQWRDWGRFLDAPAEEQLARFQHTGSLILDPGDGALEPTEDAMTEAGVAFERWSVDATEERFPYLDLHRFGPVRPIADEAFWDDPTEYLAGAVYTDQSGYIVDPSLATANLMEAARRAGARVQTSTAVDSFLVEGDRVGGVVLADGTRILAQSVIAAAGPHTSALLSTIHATDDFAVRTFLMRTEEVHVAAPPGFDMLTQGVHLVDSDLNVNFRPEGAGAFHGGSNQSAPDEQVFIDDPDGVNPTVSAEGWERLTLRLARRIPELGIPRTKSGIVGIIEGTEDWMPIYDRTRYDGLYVAMGTSGSQFKVAPLVGELVRHIVETTLEGRDPVATPYVSPVSGRAFSTAPYSRLRAPHHGRGRL